MYNEGRGRRWGFVVGPVTVTDPGLPRPRMYTVASSRCALPMAPASRSSGGGGALQGAPLGHKAANRNGLWPTATSGSLDAKGKRAEAGGGGLLGH